MVVVILETMSHVRLLVCGHPEVSHEYSPVNVSHQFSCLYWKTGNGNGVVTPEGKIDLSPSVNRTITYRIAENIGRN